jgi:hypothetical protein
MGSQKLDEEFFAMISLSIHNRWRRGYYGKTMV